MLEKTLGHVYKSAPNSNIDPIGEVIGKLDFTRIGLKDVKDKKSPHSSSLVITGLKGLSFSGLLLALIE